MLSRRHFIIAAAGGLSACTGAGFETAQPVAVQPVRRGMPDIYGPLPNERFPIPAVQPGIVPPQFWRQQVADPTGEAPGTIVVEPATRYLYLVEDGGTAMRYGIGVGRAGFAWDGEAKILDKRQWPTWTPPEEMIDRDPSLEKFSAANGGQQPGLGNALGARALYLYQGRVDTLYRIHGTPIAASIGQAMSSGCIRLLNHDIIDLYDRVPIGTRVIVNQAQAPATLT